MKNKTNVCLCTLFVLMLVAGCIPGTVVPTNTSVPITQTSPPTSPISIQSLPNMGQQISPLAVQGLPVRYAEPRFDRQSNLAGRTGSHQHCEP